MMRALAVAALGALLALAGCASRDVPVGSAPAETPLSEQIAQVERRETARIQFAGPFTDDELARCAALAELEELLLDSAEARVGGPAWSSLKKLPKLRHLRVRGAGVDDEAIAHIAELRELRILNIPRSTLTDEGLSRLAALENLEQLRFGSPQVSDAGLSALAQFPALKRLHLIDVRLSDGGLRELARIPALESLYIDGAELSDAAVDELFAAKPKLHVHFNQEHHDRDPHAHAH